MSMSDEEYTQDLARRVTPVLQEFYGIGDGDMVHHVISEALSIAATDVRSGRTAKLEYIGQLRADDKGDVQFAACPDLRDPIRRTAA